MSSLPLSSCSKLTPSWRPVETRGCLAVPQPTTPSDITNKKKIVNHSQPWLPALRSWCWWRPRAAARSPVRRWGWTCAPCRGAGTAAAGTWPRPSGASRGERCPGHSGPSREAPPAKKKKKRKKEKKINCTAIHVFIHGGHMNGGTHEWWNTWMVFPTVAIRM